MFLFNLPQCELQFISNHWNDKLDKLSAPSKISHPWALTFFFISFSPSLLSPPSSLRLSRRGDLAEFQNCLAWPGTATPSRPVCCLVPGPTCQHSPPSPPQTGSNTGRNRLITFSRWTEWEVKFNLIAVIIINIRVRTFYSWNIANTWLSQWAILWVKLLLMFCCDILTPSHHMAPASWQMSPGWMWAGGWLASFVSLQSYLAPATMSLEKIHLPVCPRLWWHIRLLPVTEIFSTWNVLQLRKYQSSSFCTGDKHPVILCVPQLRISRESLQVMRWVKSSR